MARALFKPVPATEAAEFLRSKPVVSREVFNAMLPEIKARAFVVTQVEGHDALQKVRKMRDTIAKLPEGADYRAVKKELIEQFDWLSPKKAARRAELLMRHHGLQSYRVAQGEQIERHKDVFPYLQYVATRDNRVRDTHDALNGIVLPVDDPFWLDHTPPWEWNCRCQVIQVSRARYEQIKERDAARPPEEKQILDRATRERMNSSQTLTRSTGTGTGDRPGVPMNVSLRTNPHGPATAKDLRIPVETLKKRYDADVWDRFEDAMRRQPFDERGPETMMDWLESGVSPAQHVSEVLYKTRVPAERVAALVAEDPQHPVSSALRLWGEDEDTFQRLKWGSSREAEQWRKQMDVILANIEPTALPNRSLWRGLKSRDELNAIQQNKLYMVSTVGDSFSATREVSTESFMSDQGYLLEVRNSQSGRRMSGIFSATGGSTKPQEDEYIMPRGAKFRVIDETSISVDLDGQTKEIPHIILEEF